MRFEQPKQQSSRHQTHCITYAVVSLPLEDLPRTCCSLLILVICMNGHDAINLGATVACYVSMLGWLEVRTHDFALSVGTTVGATHNCRHTQRASR